MTLSWENGQFRTSIHITEFASHYRYYNMFFGGKNQNFLGLFPKRKKKIEFINSKHSS